MIIPNILPHPVPSNALDPGVTFDIPTWLTENLPDSTEPIARKVLTALRSQGVKQIVALGSCYGGRLAFNLAFDNLVEVVVVSHPSLLVIPDDLMVSLLNVSVPVARRAALIIILTLLSRRNTLLSPGRPCSSTPARLIPSFRYLPKRR